MVKRIICLIITLGILFVTLTLGVESGAIHIKWIDEKMRVNQEKEKEKRDKAFEEAEDIFDVLPYLYKSTRRYPEIDVKYSETKDYKKLKNLTLILGYEKKYAIIDYKGERYLVFIYELNTEQKVLKKIKKVEKEYDGNTLRLTFNVKTAKKDYSIDYEQRIANCFIKIDRDVEKVIVDGVEYEKYTGDYFRCDDKWFYIDENLHLRFDENQE